MGLVNGRALLHRCVVGIAGCSLAVVLAGGGARAVEADPPPAGEQPAETRIEDFLKAAGSALGVRLAWDPSNKLIRDKSIVGGLPGATPGRVLERGQLLSLVRNMLVPYDLVMVPMGTGADRWYFVVDAKQQGAALRLKAESIELTDDNLARYEGEDGLFVSTTIRVQSLRTLRDTRTALTKVVTQNLGNVTEVPDANAFVVTDFAPNVVAIYRLIRQLDVAPADGSPARLVSLRHAKADNVSRLLNVHFAPPAPTPVNPQQAQPAPTASTGPRITSDARTNQLLISGSPSEVQAILKLIEGLDVPVEAPAASTPATTQAPTNAYVLTLKNARAQDLAKVLQNLVQSSQVWMAPDGSRPSFVPEPLANLLVVAAHEKSIAAIRALVESLDVAVPAKEPPPAPPEPVADADQRLAAPLTVSVSDGRLEDVLAGVASKLGFTVVMDVPEAKAGQRVSVDVQNQAARGILNVLTRMHGLAWKLGPEDRIRVTVAAAEAPR